MLEMHPVGFFVLCGDIPELQDLVLTLKTNTKTTNTLMCNNTMYHNRIKTSRV